MIGERKRFTPHTARVPSDAGLPRLVELGVAALGLALLSPLLVAIAIAVWAHDRGPVFFRAARVGRGGEPFRLYKFRTMRVGAERSGPAITANGDQRITPVGHWLRRTKLDELPQLLNVLRGEMRLVGPRPEDPRYVDMYTIEQRRILEAAPGITSAAALAYRHEEQLLAGDGWERFYRDEVMPAKIEIDLVYLKHRTAWTDLHLIARTAMAMFK